MARDRRKFGAKTKAPRTYNVVSLFSGCGGADLGFRGGFTYLGETFKKLPFRIRWANDVDRFAAKVYRHNLAGDISDSPVQSVNFQALELPTTDVLLAGIPCQDFAMLGPRGGLQSERGQMYKQVRRALRAFRPKLFLVENVPGIEHPLSILNTITRGLAGRSAPQYRVQIFRMNAADYAVPQSRRRVVIVGVRSDLPGEFVSPKQTRASPEEASDVQPWITSTAALDDLWCEECPDCSNVPDQGKVTKAAIFLDKPKRRDKQLQADQPAPTIRAEHHGHVELHYRPQEDGSLRRLTVRECARLQGFPDTFTFPVSFTQAYRQIGNAMPPVLVHNWAKSILGWLRALDSQPSPNGKTLRASPRDPQTTSKIMAAVKSRGSKAELALGTAMWRAGLRYRKHPGGIVGKPDYAFRGKKVAVFCDGDFWHGLSWEERGFKSWDEQFANLRNSKFWREKISRNMQRDEEVRDQLESSGWTVLRFRESDILRDAHRCAVLVRRAVAKTQTSLNGRSRSAGRKAGAGGKSWR